MYDLALPPGVAARNGLTADDVERMLPALGISAPIGEEFPCRLPGAHETQLAAIDHATLPLRNAVPRCA